MALTAYWKHRLELMPSLRYLIYAVIPFDHHRALAQRGPRWARENELVAGLVFNRDSTPLALARFDVGNGDVADAISALEEANTAQGLPGFGMVQGTVETENAQVKLVVGTYGTKEQHSATNVFYEWARLLTDQEFEHHGGITGPTFFGTETWHAEGADLPVFSRFWGPPAEEGEQEVLSREDIRKRVTELVRFITQDNALSEEQKTQIAAYLNAIDALLEPDQVDKEAVATIIDRLQRLAIELSKKVGENWAIDQVLDWIETVAGWFH